MAMHWAPGADDAWHASAEAAAINVCKTMEGHCRGCHGTLGENDGFKTSCHRCNLHREMVPRPRCAFCNRAMRYGAPLRECHGDHGAVA